MKTRSSQFGARENTASSGPHNPRVAIRSVPSDSKATPPSPEEDWSLGATTSSPTFTSNPQHDAAHIAATGGKQTLTDCLLTVREVSELLRVPVSWVYGRTRKRSFERLPGYRLGKYWRFRESEVIAWLRGQRSSGRADA